MAKVDPIEVELKLRQVAGTKSKSVHIKAAEARAILKSLDAMRLRMLIALHERDKYAVSVGARRRKLPAAPGD